MFFVLIFLFILSFFTTACMVRFAGRSQLLDVPNHRSAHQLPTPRGGGVAIVLVFFLTVFLGIYTGLLEASVWLLYLLAALLVAAIGLIDDYKNIGVWSRLWVQITSSLLCVIASVYFNVGLFADTGIAFLIPLSLVAVLAGVWLINLYNFMDGIDGIAGLQALFISSIMATLFYMSEQQDLLLLSLGLAAGSLGFLCWNIPKAKIFMGDSGSGGLGIIFFILMLWSVQLDASYLPVWLVLLSVFLVDATFTLMVRLFTGQRVFSAHNLHAYQKLTKKWGNHFYVSLSITIFNLFWVAPLAFLTYYQIFSPLGGISMAYMPVLIGCIVLKAGFIEHN